MLHMMHTKTIGEGLRVFEREFGVFVGVDKNIAHGWV